MGHGAEASQPVVDQHLCGGREDDGDPDDKWKPHTSICGRVQVLELPVQSKWMEANQHGRTNAECQQSLVEDAKITARTCRGGPSAKGCMIEYTVSSASDVKSGAGASL